MDYFDTVISITGYESSKEEFDKTSNEMIEMLGEYHRLYSIYHRFDGIENLCTINETVNGAHRTVTVDKRIIDMLIYAKEMHEKTNGVMNIAMGSVLSLWHNYRTIGKDNPNEAALPPMEELKTASQHTDISNLIIDEVNNTVTLTDPLMTLDVGAIAKGYAVERVALYFEEKGVTNYVLNVGGNVRTLGSKADGSKWTIGIENPNGGDYLAYIDLNGQSIVTSGSYQRFYYVDGVPYHHIIHPDTLMPAKGYLSVSVICNHSGLADALSTALFCLPQKEGMELIESVVDAEAMWVTEDGENIFSSGWKNYEK
jgi:thiamine biosynthesis lipoprotein